MSNGSFKTTVAKLKNAFFRFAIKDDTEKKQPVSDDTKYVEENIDKDDEGVDEVIALDGQNDDDTDIDSVEIYRKTESNDEVAENMQKSTDKHKDIDYYLDSKTKGKKNNNNKGIYLLSVLLIVSVFNTFTIARICMRYFLDISRSMLYAIKIDTIKFYRVSFLQINVLTSYLLSFILGGCMIYMLLLLVGYIAKESNGPFKKKYMLFLMFGFILIYFIGALVSGSSGNAYYNYDMYKWICPLMAYAGGLVMYWLSEIRVRIE